MRRPQLEGPPLAGVAQVGAPLQQAVARLDRGVALLTARPEAMQTWLGLPLAASSAGGASQPLVELVAALRPSGTALDVDALAQLRAPLPRRSLGSGDQLLHALQQPARSLALLSGPSDLLADLQAAPEPALAAADQQEPAPVEADQTESAEETRPVSQAADPWRTLLGPLLHQVIGQASGPLPALVAAADQGPLLWADLPEGWLLGTSEANPPLEVLQQQLAQQGFSVSPLQSRGQTLQVWTRLRSRPVKGNPDQLQAELAGARATEGLWAWWGQGLAVLHQQHESHQPPQARLEQLEAEGVEFATGVEVGRDLPAQRLLDEFDAVVLATGATVPRDLRVPGRDAQGIHFAMDFLHANTKSLLDSRHEDGRFISAKDRSVVVIGGGDTGTDCVGTSMRHGCKSLVQVEILPKPPQDRAKDNPWPEWPKTYKLDYGQEEAKAKFGEDPRIYLTTATKFEGDADGNLKAVHLVNIEWAKNDKGQFIPKNVPGTERVLPAQLVLLAMGFLGPEQPLLDALGVERDPRTNVKADHGKFQTSLPNVFAAGDCRRGQSLVVWAFNEGRGAARECDRYLMGKTDLP